MKAQPVARKCLVRDQAELIGVLNSLYEMHLPLISVGFINDDEDLN